VVGDGAAGYLAQYGGDVREAERLRPREVVVGADVSSAWVRTAVAASAMSSWATTAARPVPPGPRDDAVVADQSGHEVGVEVVPQEGVLQAARADVLFGVPVVAGQGEGRFRGCP